MAEFFFCEMMHLTMMWWRFALDQQSASDHHDSKYCCDDSSKCSHHKLGNRTLVIHKGWDNEPVAMVVLPQKRKCCHKKVIKRNDIQDGKGLSRVIHQLLMQAGDVETNPGPGICIMKIN